MVAFSILAQSLFAVASLAYSSAPAYHSAGPWYQTQKAPRALYYQSNNATGNTIIALKVESNGTTAFGSITATNGLGAYGLSAKDGSIAAPDTFFSQGAVTVGDGVLFAVNAGSNTLSMFNIDRYDPTRLTIIGAPVSTLGEFPVSVAFSAKLSQACVANIGAVAGVTCYSVSKLNGLTLLDKERRPYALNSTTPPRGPLIGISQVSFNADSTALYTVVKGNGSTSNVGYFSVFPVKDGLVSRTRVDSVPKGIGSAFGFAETPNGNVVISDVTIGSLLVKISPDTHKATTILATNIPEKIAVCWATYSPATGTVFIDDVAATTLHEIDPKSGKLISNTAFPNGNPGYLDMAAAGDFLYALSPGNATTRAALTVFDVSAGAGKAPIQIQNLILKGLADVAEGLALLW